MADSSKRFMSLPLSLVMRDAVGFTFQVWQPPIDGWEPLSELRRGASADELAAAQREYIVRHGGTMWLVLDPPGWKRPNFGRARRG